MNGSHLHLLLNHVPTVGFGAATVLFLVGLMKKSPDLTQASFAAFFVGALLAIPAYVSGNAAEFILRDEPGMSASVLAAHQNAAVLGFVFIQVTGLVGWVALWRFRQWTIPALLALSVATFALMARAANIGGGIRHLEILAGETAESGGAWPELAAMGTALIVNYPWVWPICEIFHFVGLCLLFGVALLVNLRMLGFIEGVAFADINRLLPWAVIGLVINLITGMLFFLAAPDQYTQNAAFAWKIGLMVVAGATTLLYPIMSDEIRTLKQDGQASLAARCVAASSICLWIGIIFLGRFLPYLGSE